MFTHAHPHDLNSQVSFVASKKFGRQKFLKTHRKKCGSPEIAIALAMSFCLVVSLRVRRHFHSLAALGFIQIQQPAHLGMQRLVAEEDWDHQENRSFILRRHLE